MSNAPRAVVIRIAVLLLVSCAAAFAWESAGDAGARHVVGTVVHVRPVPAGRGGDSKEFTIRYRWHGQAYEMVTRRGIVDAFGSLSGLKAGDSVPLAVRPEAPGRAVLDTVSGRYGITLSFVALTVIFVGALAFLALTGRLSSSGER